MSSVDVSRPNVDVVNLEISQEGSADTHCQFRLPFLLSDKKYTCACTSLTVPLMNTRMLQNPLPPLLYLRRRNVGERLNEAAMTYLDGNGLVGFPQIALHQDTVDAFPSDEGYEQDPAVFTTNAIPMLNVADFLVLLNSYSAVFTNRIHAVGINSRLYGGHSTTGETAFAKDTAKPGVGVPPDMFHFGVTPSGHLFITMEPGFTNHFFFEVSTLGQQLLGLPSDIIAVTQNQQTGAIDMFGEVGFTVAVGGDNTIQPATVSVVTTIYGERSLLQTLENRISVHVESNLDIMKTITAQNSVEGANFDLCSFAIRNESTARIKIMDIGVTDEMTFVVDTHCGQAVLQARSDAPTQWNALLHSQDITSFKLRLYMRVRKWNAGTEKWFITKEEFPMLHSTDRWTCGLRFVSLE